MIPNWKIPKRIRTVCNTIPLIMFRAYAKINLGLLVHDRKTDGYHGIETVFHLIDLFDELNIEESPIVEIVCLDPAIPTDEKNLCHRAVMMLKDHLRTSKGARITLTKNIPVGAGLGGGSADAALVLRELPRIWGMNINRSALEMLALRLGSDVPYFLRPGTARARGRGELLEYFQLNLPFTILISFPNIFVSTKWAYSRIDELRPQGQAAASRSPLARVIHPGNICEHLANDFEPIVFETYPVVRQIKETMLRSGATCASLSGSGSSVFGLFADLEQARLTSQLLAAQGQRAFLSPAFFNPEKGIVLS
jgi:4-diphosphocytidyl-2-C-methyl-D-erythritol kinase